MAGFDEDVPPDDKRQPFRPPTIRQTIRDLPTWRRVVLAIEILVAVAIIAVLAYNLLLVVLWSDG